MFGLANSFFAQNNSVPVVYDRGEVILKLSVTDFTSLDFNRKLSVDKIVNDSIIVYSNNEQFNAITSSGIKYSILPQASYRTIIEMATTKEEMANWNKYPTYDTYITMMKDFASNYPQLCRLDTIGFSVLNRAILALKISNNPDIDKKNPEVFLTSSMHGDELTGYILMLRLADSILSNASNIDIASLINSVDLYINPLSNPDGAYYKGNNTVDGSRRFNKNGIDLNRNFPDAMYGEHPDGYEWQQENIAMMEFMKKHNFVLSANFHGGAEVLNYPWDVFSRRHPDNNWFISVSRSYADTVHLTEPYYLTDFDNGITNGFDWYTITGGRQDYTTWFCHGREITMEISTEKLVDSPTLPFYWNANAKSLIQYINQVNFGIRGKISDSEGNPVKAKITVLNHDADNSEVYSDSAYGMFYRLIEPGEYTLNIEAKGFKSKIVQAESLNEKGSAIDVVLDSLSGSSDKYSVAIEVFPNPCSNTLTVQYDDSMQEAKLKIWSIDGKLVFEQPDFKQVEQINISNLQSGIYILNLYNKQLSAQIRFSKQ